MKRASNVVKFGAREEQFGRGADKKRLARESGRKRRAVLGRRNVGNAKIQRAAQRGWSRKIAKGGSREEGTDRGGTKGRAGAGVGVRVPRVAKRRRESVRRGGGWWRSRAGENAVCKAGGEFKRSCAERMASPRATLPRSSSLSLSLSRSLLLSLSLGLVLALALARPRLWMRLLEHPHTGKYDQRGEGATDTETDSRTKREGRREEATRSREKHGQRRKEGDRSLAPSHWFPHRFSLSLSLFPLPLSLTCPPRGTRARRAKLRTSVSRTADTTGRYDLLRRRTVRTRHTRGDPPQ